MGLPARLLHALKDAIARTTPSDSAREIQTDPLPHGQGRGGYGKVGELAFEWTIRVADRISTSCYALTEDPCWTYALSERLGTSRVANFSASRRVPRLETVPGSQGSFAGACLGLMSA